MLMHAFKDLLMAIKDESTVQQSTINELEVLESSLLKKFYSEQPEEDEVDTFHDAARSQM